MKEVWYKKYRPREVKDYVFQDDFLKSKVEEWIEKKFFGNIMLLGSPGSGKTSLAKLLVEQCGFDDSDVRYISASLTNGIDDIREKVVNFSERSSFGMNGRVVVLDECLEENEEIRIGNLEEWKPIPLNKLEWGITYPTVSFNMTTGEFENDTCELVSDKEDTIYEIGLECGKKVLLNAKHPMIIDNNGVYEERNINDGLQVGDSIVIMDSNSG